MADRSPPGASLAGAGEASAALTSTMSVRGLGRRTQQEYDDRPAVGRGSYAGGWAARRGVVRQGGGGMRAA